MDHLIYPVQPQKEQKAQVDQHHHILVKKLDQIGLEQIDSNTGLINIEIPMRAMRKGCRWTQGIIDTKPRLSGDSKVTNLRTTLLTLWETVKLRFTISRDQKTSVQDRPERVAPTGPR